MNVSNIIEGVEISHCRASEEYDRCLRRLEALLRRMNVCSVNLHPNDDRHGINEYLDECQDRIDAYRRAVAYPEGSFPEEEIPNIVMSFRLELLNELHLGWDDLVSDHDNEDRSGYYMSVDAACRILTSRLRYGRDLRLATTVTFHSWSDGRYNPYQCPHPDLVRPDTVHRWRADIDNICNSIEAGIDEDYHSMCNTIERWSSNTTKEG